MTTPQQPPRRVDASMTLLTEVMDRPLDPSYAALSEARVRAGEPAARSANGPLAIVATITVGVLLAVGAVQLRAPEEGSLRARDVLAAEIERRSAAVDSRAESIAALQAEVAQLQEAALPDDAAAQRLERLSIATGASSVTGPGIEVTLDDAPSTREDPVTGQRSTETDEGRVRDRDLQLVVNGLWAAGAEGISINDQRLTSLASIRAAGQAILVDYRPLSPPYVVHAIGDPDTMPARFAATPAGPYLDTVLGDRYGISSDVTAVDDLTLPASATLSLREAEPIELPPVPDPADPDPADPDPADPDPADPDPAGPDPATPEDTP